MPDFVHPESTRVQIAQEATWATAETNTDVFMVVPVEPPEIREEMPQIVDESVRGLLARDYEAWPGMRQVTGSLAGPVYAAADAVVNGALDGPIGMILGAFFGDDTNTELDTNASFDIHNFHVDKNSGSLSVLVDDGVIFDATTDNSAPVYEGVMIPSLTLSFDANEGFLRWEADLLGAAQTWPAASSMPTNSDQTGEGFQGWQASVAINSSPVQNPTPVTGKVLSAEITMEREIELRLAADSAQSDDITRLKPSLRAMRPPRVTFTSVVEFQDLDDYKKYSDAGGGTTYADNQDAWTFRFSNEPNLDTSTNDSSLNTTLGTDTSLAVLDVRLHSVSYGEAPLTVSRGDTFATMEFSGRALYNEPGAGNYFGANPASADQPGSNVAQVRLVNGAQGPYTG